MSHAEVLRNMLEEFELELIWFKEINFSALEAKIEALEYAIKLIEDNNVPITE